MIYECAFGGIALPAGASWSGVNNVPSDFTLGGTGVPGWHTPLVLFGGKTILLNRAHREPEEPAAVALRIDTTTVKVQVPRITGRVERSRPVVTVRTTAVPRCTTADAGASKKQPIAIYLGL